MGTGTDDDLRAADILETARQISELRLFVEAIERVGLTIELKGPDLHTLFAPVNEALDSSNFWRELQKPQRRERLAQLILLHIVHGRQTEADLRTVASVRTLSGEPVTVEYRAEGSRFGDAHVIRRDIACRNGIIHLIDRLIIREYSYAG